MNTFNAAALLNTNLTTLKGYFAHLSADGNFERVSKSDYTWFCTHGLASILSPGDVVVAIANNEFKLVVVSSIQPDAEIDLDAGFRYNFAIQKVRIHEHERLLLETEENAKKLNQSRTQALRAQVAAQFGAHSLTFNPNDAGSKE